MKGDWGRGEDESASRERSLTYGAGHAVDVIALLVGQPTHDVEKCGKSEG